MFSKQTKLVSTGSVWECCEKFKSLPRGKLLLPVMGKFTGASPINLKIIRKFFQL